MERGQSGLGPRWNDSRDRMRVLETMGDIFGNPRDIHLALPDKGIDAYEQALALAEAALNREEDDVRAQRDTDRILRKLALMVVDKNPERAIALCTRALAISQALVKASPGIPGLLRDQADGILITGYGIENLHRVKEAIGYYEKVLAMQTEIRRISPDSRRFRREMEETLSSLGDAHLKLGNYPESMRFYEKGREITVGLLWDRPTDAYLMRDLADLNEQISAWHALAARRGGPSARQHWKQAIEAMEKNLKTWTEWPRKFSPGAFAAQREQHARQLLEEYGKAAAQAQ
jgi:tetratricopeptide (TPR) repeat protein